MALKCLKYSTPFSVRQTISKDFMIFFPFDYPVNLIIDSDTQQIFYKNSTQIMKTFSFEIGLRL